MQRTVLALLVLAVAACGESAQPQEGAAGSAGSAPVGPIWPSDATKVKAQARVVCNRPSTSPNECCAGDVLYSLSVTDLWFAWGVCKLKVDGSSQTWVIATSGRTLVPEEYASMDAAMKALAFAANPQCSADKTTRLVTVGTASGEVSYHDNHGGCGPSNATYVDNEDGVFSAMDALAR